MAPVTKARERDVSITGKRQRKRKAEDLDAEGEGDVATAVKKRKNKQRVLLLSSRGITHRMRHLMNDLETLLPHFKKGVCTWCGRPRLLPSPPRMCMRIQTV
jgi:ribosome biogenesis protein BRX1